MGKRYASRYQEIDAIILRDHATRHWKDIVAELGISKVTFYRRAKAIGITWPRKYPDGYYELDDSRQKAVRKKEKYWSDPEYRARQIEKAQAWQRNNRAKYMLRSLRHRAQRDRIPFNLDASDLVVPDHCPVLGIPLEWRDGRHYGSPSVDRIKPELGYVKGNVRVISDRANRLRSDASLDELERVVMYVRAIESGEMSP